MSEEASEYGLVMPFVVCQSQGGPYEDQAFAAGYALGQLDQLLEQASKDGHRIDQEVVRTASVPQVDLIAMRYGYTTRIEEAPGTDGEWSHASFTPAAP